MPGRGDHSGVAARGQAYPLASLLMLGVASVVTAAPATSSSPLPLTVEQITSRMMQVDEQRRASLPEFSVIRKYILRNAHMQRDAEMLVRVSYRKGDGKTFQVLETESVEGICKRVFQHLIDAERDASHSDNHGRLSSQNYNFELAGTDQLDARPCYVLALHPKNKTKYLFNGKVWVDAGDFAVVKLEGRPAANVSFWAGKPWIVQTWQKTGGFWMAAKNRSVSESRLIGPSELIVDNTRYEFGAVATAPVRLGSQAKAARTAPRLN